jgi:uncharacterized protein YjiS (DUF1127 family)
MRHAYGDYSEQPSQLEARRYLARGITRFRDRMREWQQRVRVRNELMMLSDHDLRDLRWTRPDVEAEARKPFHAQE